MGRARTNARTSARTHTRSHSPHIPYHNTYTHRTRHPRVRGHAACVQMCAAVQRFAVLFYVPVVSWQRTSSLFWPFHLRLETYLWRVEKDLAGLHRRASLSCWDLFFLLRHACACVLRGCSSLECCLFFVGHGLRACWILNLVTTTRLVCNTQPGRLHV